MQSKRRKRSRIRAAKITAGHGHKKKNRGAGHRGGRGKSGSGKRGDFKLMKVTSGKKYLGKIGFTSIKNKPKTINIETLQNNLGNFVDSKGVIDLTKQGYDKLLSKGNVAKDLSIKVKKVTKKALEKIEKAGGKIITE